ncbi:o-succinylbenzoate--CoA ligase [Labedaea rhizosphaerae]|uniref:o-succinylbenzoate--CoA ligase n=1 Tax=Labedaea rhizosphaerae TaxID=598644 RepID=UPI00105BE9D0|nr:o-succinylbenzoate--CoA ligase [Labedaea rhizosphaerae]
MREVLLDGGTRAVHALAEALSEALAGGPAVLPVADGSVRAAMAPDKPVEPGTAVIVATSGSTGEPKGVLLSAGALRASADATHERLGGPGGWLLAMPAHHVAGIQVLVRTILAGRDPAVLDLTGGFRPSTFVAAAAPVLATPGPHYTALVPTQLSRLVRDEAGLAALRAFDGVLIGGAATPQRLVDQARAAGVRMWTTYGMSETAGGCVYDGVPLRGVRVRLGDGGVIELGGPTLSHGYRLRPELTAQAFAGQWFRTSDLGRLDGDHLTVLGRVDDVINTGGEKVPAAAVERVLCARPGVGEACVVGLPDPEWGERVVALVVPDGTPPATADLQAAVRAELGAAATPKEIRFAPAMPLRGPGKIDRTAVRATLAHGN